mmetsp:Transcript_28284/g.53054  ORF Transcript_28284/g.53054 Transcript_28284/m.53054 type:complete len:574 (+) Transcript_28284:65-1786(+)
MRSALLVLICTLCIGHARRVQTPNFRQQVMNVAKQMTANGETVDVKALAALLLASSPRSAFAAAGAGARLPSSNRHDGVKMSTNADAPIKLGVNGFGRIGRQVVRIAMDREAFVLKHINSPMSPEYMKYLLNHDTVHGRFDGTVEISDDGLIINGLPVSLSATRDPTEIPWKAAGVEYVCESTGAFTTTEGCLKHIESGAKKVIISAPAKDADTPTIVVGVNTDDYESSMQVVSCASCTTNGLAPLVKVINEKFGIKQGLMTTVHAATASQLTVDGSMKGKDWRAGRAASANIIPSSTGAAKAVAKAYPVMKGKLTGMAFRVPTVDVSVVDLTCELEKETTYEDIKAEVKLASETYAKGVVGYTEDQVVSSDFIGETCSTVFDAEAGIMLTPTFVKLVSWYDNEWGYSTRLVDLVGLMAAADGVTTKEKALAYFTARAAKDTRKSKRSGEISMQESPDWSQALEEAEAKTIKTIAAVLDVAESKITKDTTFEDLGVKQDEIDPDWMFNPKWLDIIMALEEELNLEVVPSKYFDMNTVGSLVDYYREATLDKLNEKEGMSPWYGEGEGPPPEML